MACSSFANAAHQAPIRSAISPFRRLAQAALLAVALAGPAGAQNGPSALQLTLPQARIFALEALRQGRVDAAMPFVLGLIKANPRDAQAHYMLATALAQSGQSTPARRSAARAYRFASPGPQRFRAAQLAAQLAYAEKRPSLAQIWLRRTAIHAQTDRDEALLARDYQALRRLNPWSFRLSGGIRPSSNVNGGADSVLNTIDGTPDSGFLPVAAQALSGYIGSVDASLTYRLRSNAKSATSITGRVYVQRVALADESKRRGSSVSGSQFGATYSTLALRHAFALGPPEAGGSGALTLTLGDSWYGGARSYQFIRVGGERTWSLGQRDQVQLNAHYETRERARFVANDAEITGVGVHYAHKRASGDTVSVALNLRDSDSLALNGTFQSATLRSTYSFARQMGPARLSLGLTLGHTNYDRYALSTIIAATERTDQSAYGDVTLFFPNFDYAGFAPTLRLRAGRKTSNFSRFSSSELSLSLGIQSKF